MDFRENIINSVKEIFTTMVMMEIEEGAVVDTEVSPLENTITGLIGLAGTHKGLLAIHFPNSVACAITTNFLGMDVDEVNEDVEDAIGEIANMLGGSVKSFLSAKGKDIDLSLPSTVSGKEYDFQTLKGAERYLIRFDADSGSFIVEFQIEN